MNQGAAVTKVIHEEVNPYQNLRAVVESDERTIYLYLTPDCESPFEPRALWLRNLVAAPEQKELEAMEKGVPPLCPQEASLNLEGSKPPQAGSIELVWSQEGSGLAIFIKGELQGYLPPRSERGQFFGYSSGLKAPHAGSIPFPKGAHMERIQQRISSDRKFWQSRQSGASWKEFRDRMLAFYESAFGPHTDYYAVMDRPYPPLAIVEFQRKESFTCVTLGMSQQSQTPLRYDESEAPGSRLEIIVQSQTILEWLPSAMGNIAAYPWVAYRPIGHGELFATGVDGGNFLINCYSNIPDITSSSFSVDNIKVDFLQAHLLTTAEFEKAKNEGTEFLLKELI